MFTKLPGIGPKQAGRLTFFIVKENSVFSRELSQAILEVKEKIITCANCFRAIEKDNNKTMCNLCSDTKREQTIIAVVEKESDMKNLEKTGVYHGLYHVLGGVIAPLDAESPKKLHLKELFERVKDTLEKEQKAEVVLATNTTTEGEATALYIERILSPLKNTHPQFKTSRLGRGLSVGAELEYADEVTIKNAFVNRK